MNKEKDSINRLPITSEEKRVNEGYALIAKEISALSV
jgi:hypothetical protein